MNKYLNNYIHIIKVLTPIVSLVD